MLVGLSFFQRLARLAPVTSLLSDDPDVARLLRILGDTGFVGSSPRTEPWD